MKTRWRMNKINLVIVYYLDSAKQEGPRQKDFFRFLPTRVAKKVTFWCKLPKILQMLGV